MNHKFVKMEIVNLLCILLTFEMLECRCVDLLFSVKPYNRIMVAMNLQLHSIVIS